MLIYRFTFSREIDKRREMTFEYALLSMKNIQKSETRTNTMLLERKTIESNQVIWYVGMCACT
jgi:hypothetical protein